MEIPFQVMGGFWPRHQWGADLDGGPIASLRAAAQEVQRRDERRGAEPGAQTAADEDGEDGMAWWDLVD